MIDTLILRLIEFLVIRYEGVVWAEIRTALGKHKEAQALVQVKKDLDDAVTKGDETKIQAAGAADLNGTVPKPPIAS